MSNLKHRIAHVKSGMGSIRSGFQAIRIALTGYVYELEPYAPGSTRVLFSPKPIAASERKQYA